MHCEVCRLTGAGVAAIGQGTKGTQETKPGIGQEAVAAKGPLTGSPGSFPETHRNPGMVLGTQEISGMQETPRMIGTGAAAGSPQRTGTRGPSGPQICAIGDPDAPQKIGTGITGNPQGIKIEIGLGTAAKGPVMTARMAGVVTPSMTRGFLSRLTTCSEFGRTELSRTLMANGSILKTAVRICFRQRTVTACCLCECVHPYNAHNQIWQCNLFLVLYKFCLLCLFNKPYNLMACSVACLEILLASAALCM